MEINSLKDLSWTELQLEVDLLPSHPKQERTLGHLFPTPDESYDSKTILRKEYKQGESEIAWCQIIREKDNEITLIFDNPLGCISTLIIIWHQAIQMKKVSLLLTLWAFIQDV